MYFARWCSITYIYFLCKTDIGHTRVTFVLCTLNDVKAVKYFSFYTLIKNPTCNHFPRVRLAFTDYWLLQISIVYGVRLVTRTEGDRHPRTPRKPRSAAGTYRWSSILEASTHLWLRIKVEASDCGPEDWICMAPRSQTAATSSFSVVQTQPAPLVAPELPALQIFGHSEPYFHQVR